jgi:hypothetical protein
MRRIAQFSFLLGLLSLTSACLVAEPRDHPGYAAAEPREGYWDREHGRYYHEHGWHECSENDHYCR